MRWVNHNTRRLVALAIYAALLMGGMMLARYFGMTAEEELRASHVMGPVVLMVLGAFLLLSALPFVPGVEIGVGLLLVFGGKIAMGVYLSMVLALLIAYGVGRFVPVQVCSAAFGYLGFHKARGLVEDLSQLTRQDRLTYLTQHAPNRFLPFLLRHRYLGLMLILNMPGNALIGGAGGIGLAVGMSGLYNPLAYLGAILVAVAPVPIFCILWM